MTKCEDCCMNYKIINDCFIKPAERRFNKQLNEHKTKILDRDLNELSFKFDIEEREDYYKTGFFVSIMKILYWLDGQKTGTVYELTPSKIANIPMVVIIKDNEICKKKIIDYPIIIELGGWNKYRVSLGHDLYYVGMIRYKIITNTFKNELEIAMNRFNDDRKFKLNFEQFCELFKINSKYFEIMS